MLLVIHSFMNWDLLGRYIAWLCHFKKEARVCPV